jgi:hypothetical protein
MNRKSALSIFISLLAAVCLSACTGMGMETADLRCNDASPNRDVTISYGDSELTIKDKDQRAKPVKRDDYLVFKLDPDKTKGPNDLNYETVTVTVKGKDSDSSWIYKSGKYVDSAKHELVICVPNDVTTDKTYFYEITVDEVGTLDPRVIVEP